MKYQTLHFDIIDSTNLYLKNHYKELDDFTFVSSSFQEKGRGRGDHIWLSNKGDNLLFSLLIKNKEIIKISNYLSLVSGVSICMILEKNKFENVSIKWPNDIYINDKKLAGILLESQLPNYIIIGIGININQKKFVGSYHVNPTSLYLEKHIEIDLESIKKEIYDSLIDNIIKCKDNLEIIHSYFKDHNYLLNKKIKYVLNNKNGSGIVLGIDSDFSLLVNDNSKIIKINSGEVNLL